MISSNIVLIWRQTRQLLVSSIVLIQRQGKQPLLSFILLMQRRKKQLLVSNKVLTLTKNRLLPVLIPEHVAEWKKCHCVSSRQHYIELILTKKAADK